MELSDMVLALDKRQGHRNADARVCPGDENRKPQKRHGRLQAAPGASVLVCCAADCGYREPVSVIG